MLKLLVVDSSAESRNRIIAEISTLLRSDNPDVALLPQISIKPLSVEELKFHAAPDILIVGDELSTQDLSHVGGIRRALPQTPILVRLTAQQSRLAVIEQLARLGADDVWPNDATANEFLRKLVLLSRKVQKSKSGKLIVVDGGKGGVGVTSVCAALADCLVAEGKKVLVVDLDTQTQDLSRFLQARPFINENLQLLLEQTRPITQETVEQSVSQVWQDEPAFLCMPPLAESDSLLDPRSPAPRLFMQILEVVDSLYDCVIVDIASTQGALLRTLYRVADKLLFVVNGDPASMFASVDRFSRMRGGAAPDAKILVVENGTALAGLSHSILRDEFLRVAKIQPDEWFEGGIPYSKQGAAWPASGATMFTHGSARVRDRIVKLTQLLELVEKGEQSVSASGSLLARVRSLWKRAAPVPSNSSSTPTLPDAANARPLLAPVSSPNRGALLTHVTTARPDGAVPESSNRATLLQLRPPQTGNPGEDKGVKLDPRKLVSGATFS